MHNTLSRHVAASCTVIYEKAHYQGFILIPFAKTFTQYDVQNSSLKDKGMDFNVSVDELNQILSVVKILSFHDENGKVDKKQEFCQTRIIE